MSILNRHVALVSQTQRVTLNQLVIVAAALQKQATRDLGPIWEVNANVSAFASPHDVPSDYWTIFIRDTIPYPGAGGIHLNRHDHQPYALVAYSNDWSRTISHELCEMLVDPFGNRLVAGESPKPGQGRVNFAVEVCDPSEAGNFGYTVNGVAVSDFYTPHFFDPETSSAVRYSFTGAVKAPRTILKGGYLSWFLPSNGHLWQMQWFNTASPEFIDRSGQFQLAGSLRESIDRITFAPEPKVAPQKGRAKIRISDIVDPSTAKAASEHADLLLQEIEALIAHHA